MDLLPKPVGGRLGFFDDEFEQIIEKSFDGATNAVKETAGILTELVKGTLIFQETASTSAKSSVDNDKQQEAVHKRSFYQQMEVNRKDVEHQKMAQAMESLARMEVSAMSTEEKNILEGLNADLKAEYTNNPYHISNIRNKRLEQIRQAKKQQQTASLQAATKPNFINRLDAQEGQSMVANAIASAG